MGAFELRGDDNFDDSGSVAGVEGSRLDPRRMREECIIALKVYDSCRQRDCKLLQRKLSLFYFYGIMQGGFVRGKGLIK